MKPPPLRRFSLLDAMILVAACALGAMSIRPTIDLCEEHWFGTNEILPSFINAILHGVTVLVSVLPPWLASFSVAFVVLRFRQPRPHWRRLLRQPGTTACLAVIPILAIGASLASLSLALVGPPWYGSLYSTTLVPILDPPATAVVAVWTLQALAGRWKAESSWIDRLGRAIGWGWVFLMLLSTWSIFWEPAVMARYSPVPLPGIPPPGTPPSPPLPPMDRSPFDLPSMPPSVDPSKVTAPPPQPPMP